MQYGRYEGTRFTDVPLGYLRWMIREKCNDWQKAKNEVERRRWAARENAANGWRKVEE